MSNTLIRRPDLLAGGTICMVCHRRLKHPSSVSLGMGAVCAKNFGARLQTLRNQSEYRQVIENWRKHNDSKGNTELYRAGEFVLDAAQQEHKARMKYTTEGAALRRLEQGEAEVPSFERGRGQVRFYQSADPNVAVAMSDSGKTYAIALSADHSHAVDCSCPAHIYSPDRDRACRHMQAYNTSVGAQREQEEKIRVEQLQKIETERQQRVLQIEQTTQEIVARLEEELAILKRKAEHGRLTADMYEQLVKENEQTRALAPAIALASTSRVAMVNMAHAMLELAHSENFSERRHA